MFLTLSCNEIDKPEILVFTKTAGYRHESIEAGIEAIKKIGAENSFVVDVSENADIFTKENLTRYAAVIFLNTSGDVLDSAQQLSFEQYIRSGGGFTGIHAASDTEPDWPWFQQLVGATFKNHPPVCKATLKVVENNHPATAMLPEIWERTDEWYNFKWRNPEVTPLILLDETSYEGGENGDYHPIAWFHEFDGGRAFYTGGGHTKETFSEPLFLQHLLGGIRYAMGISQTKSHF